MRRRFARILRWLMLALTGAMLYQTVAFTTSDNAYGTCPRFTTEGVLTPIDFCYIFDCQSGFLGGAIQPCGDPTTADDDLFVDCPGNAGAAQ